MQVLPTLPTSPLENSETVFIMFSQVLFNPWVAGFLLAAILSAIMSTVDSQLLVSSSALANDFYKSIFRRNASKKEEMIVGRIAVLGIAVIAIFLGYDPDSKVLELVELCMGWIWCSLWTCYYL